MQWDGTVSSSLIISAAGFSFETADAPYNISNFSGSGSYEAAANLIDMNLDSYSVTASSLNAISIVVPEPSTILGMALGLTSILGFRSRTRR